MFRPGATFAYLRWSSSDFGTIHSSIQIVTAVAVGEPHTALPFVRPGGEILLHIESWPQVSRVLEAVDAVEAAGVDPCDASPDPWRPVAARPAAGMPFRTDERRSGKEWVRKLRS